MRHTGGFDRMRYVVLGPSNEDSKLKSFFASIFAVNGFKQK